MYLFENNPPHMVERVAVNYTPIYLFKKYFFSINLNSRNFTGSN